MAFLDARWMVVADDFGDTLSMVDRTANTVTSIPIDTSDALHGTEPSTLACDPGTNRLYVTWSGRNAIAAYDVDTTQTPPAVTPAGMLPTGWWPSGVVVESDGSVVVSEMRGHGTGPRPLYFTIGNSDIDHRMRGGIQHVPAPSSSDLVRRGRGRRDSRLAGDAPRRARPSRAPPASATSPCRRPTPRGPSTAIQHVFFIVRENKGFDGVLGDIPGANGDPAYLLKSAVGDMDDIWNNFRTLARTFAISDNYYTDAIYSTQGHVWATYGRTNDFNERTWAISGERAQRARDPGRRRHPGRQARRGVALRLARRRTASSTTSSARSSAAPRTTRRCRPPWTASTRAARSRTSGPTTCRRPATSPGARACCATSAASST